MATASLHVNKLSAAKRQLQAAIRMFFIPEDELAIHTIAAAVYEILKDIKAARGMNEAADAYLYAYFYLVRDYHRGILPEHMTNDAAFMAEVKTIADELPLITADTKLSDVKVSIGPALQKQYWDDNHRAANFLKHADRDTDATLSLDLLDNEHLLTKCSCAYQDVAPDDLGNEGLIFQAYITANNESYQFADTAFDDVVRSMRNIPVESRKQLCCRLIKEMNADDEDLRI